MKHTPVAILGSDLWLMIPSGADWIATVGISDEVRDEIGFLRSKLMRSPKQSFDVAVSLRRAEEIRETEMCKELRDTWWVVTWPDHVGVPHYNSDAKYLRVDSLTDALAMGAVEYGTTGGSS